MAYVTDPLPDKVLAQEEKERRELAQVLARVLNGGKLPSMQNNQPEDDWQPPPAEADLTQHRDLYTLSCGGAYERTRPWLDDPEINPPIGPNARISQSGHGVGLLADKSQTDQGAV